MDRPTLIRPYYERSSTFFRNELNKNHERLRILVTLLSLHASAITISDHCRPRFFVTSSNIFDSYTLGFPSRWSVLRYLQNMISYFLERSTWFRRTLVTSITESMQKQSFPAIQPLTRTLLYPLSFKSSLVLLLLICSHSKRLLLFCLKIFTLKNSSVSKWTSCDDIRPSPFLATSSKM